MRRVALPLAGDTMSTAGTRGWSPIVLGRSIDTIVFHIPIAAEVSWPSHPIANKPNARDLREWVRGLPLRGDVKIRGGGWRWEPTPGVALEWGTRQARAGGTDRAGIRVTLGPDALWAHGEGIIPVLEAILADDLKLSELSLAGSPLYRVDYCVDFRPPPGVDAWSLVGWIADRWRADGRAAVSDWCDCRGGRTVARGRRGKGIQTRFYVKTAPAKWHEIYRYAPTWERHGWRLRCSRCRCRFEGPPGPDIDHIGVAPGEIHRGCGGEFRPEPVVRLECEIPRKRLHGETLGEAIRYARLWCADRKWIARWASPLQVCAGEVTLPRFPAPAMIDAMAGIPLWIWRLLRSGSPAGLQRKEHRPQAVDGARVAYFAGVAARALARAREIAAVVEWRPALCTVADTGATICDVDEGTAAAPIGVFHFPRQEILGGRDPLAVHCPACGVPRGVDCVSRAGAMRQRPHGARVREAAPFAERIPWDRGRRAGERRALVDPRGSSTIMDRGDEDEDD